MLILWGVALFVTPHLAYAVLPGEDSGKVGLFGDMFGAVNSLFSGVALVGVVVTLYYQVWDKRREAKPFVVPSFDKLAACEVDRPDFRAGEQYLSMKFPVQLKNTGASAALNVEVKLEIEDVAASADILPIPLAASEEVSIEIEMEAVGKRAVALASGLRKSKLRLNVGVRCNSIDGVRWETVCSKNLQPSPLRRDEELRMLEQTLRTPDSQAPIGDDVVEWADGDTIVLVGNPVRDSWKFSEVGGGD